MEELKALLERLRSARSTLANEGRTLECDWLYDAMCDVERVMAMLVNEDETVNAVLALITDA